MNIADLLSDTVYREQACKCLDDMIRGCKRFPITKAQIYGLRQIAGQQPWEIKDYAERQRSRAARQESTHVHEEVAFWTLVGDVCDSMSRWSTRKEGLKHAPECLREENIPARRDVRTNEERSRRNELKARQQQWLVHWEKEHVPAFFDRFCTHALYLLECIKSNERGTET